MVCEHASANTVPIMHVRYCKLLRYVGKHGCGATSKDRRLHPSKMHVCGNHLHHTHGYLWPNFVYRNPSNNAPNPDLFFSKRANNPSNLGSVRSSSKSGSLRSCAKSVYLQ